MASTLSVINKCTYSNDLDILVKTFWGYSGTAPSDSELDTFAGDVEAAWVSHLNGLCSTDISMVETTVTDLTSDTAARGVSTSVANGTRSGDPLGAQICFLTPYSIARRYRGGKPRTYWPFGVYDDLLDPQHWTTTFVTAVQTGVGAWQSEIAALTWSGATISGQVNVSYYNGFKPVAGSTGRYRNVSLVRGSGEEGAGPVIPPDPILSTSYSQLLATQRRRTTRKR
jgi:hypothetical protein